MKRYLHCSSQLDQYTISYSPIKFKNMFSSKLEFDNSYTNFDYFFSN